MSRRFAIAMALLLALPQGASADEAETPPLTLAATAIGDAIAGIAGGVRRGGRLLGKADLTASLAGGSFGLSGLTGFLDMQAGAGGDFSGRFVGDAQTVSNIDGPAGVRLANAWLARDFDGLGGIKAGVIDLNTEFDVQSTAALFLDSSFGIGPDFSQAGANGPSIFPSTGLGLVGWWLPGDHWQLKAGLFEGVPGNPDHPGRTSFAFTSDEGVLLALEVRNHLTPDFTLGLGAWHHTADFDALDPMRGRVSGNSGLYASADGLIYKPEGAEAGLSGWLRLGLAQAAVNPVTLSLGAGLVLAAPFGREADQTGIAVTHVSFGGPTRRAAALRAGETSFEATYALNLNSHLTLQPDLQFVLSPGGNVGLADALVVGSRLIATW